MTQSKTLNSSENTFFLLSVMVHCRERGDEMIVGDLSHLHIYEQGGSAQVWLREKESQTAYIYAPCVAFLY